MTALHRLRRAVQSLGLDVSRFPGEHPGALVASLLRHHQVELVLDVGANDGGYAQSLRRFGYEGRIASFEPVAEPYQRAARAAERDERWTVLPYALGPTAGEATIHVAGNAGASSSFLAMNETHATAAPQSVVVAQQRVPQRTLDEMWSQLVRPDDVVFLKLDVQGYEQHVLAGGTSSLAAPHLIGLQLEMSLVPLYQDAWLYSDVLDWTCAQGWSLARVVPGFTDPRSGWMLQADGVFFRRPFRP